MKPSARARWRKQRAHSSPTRVPFERQATLKKSDARENTTPRRTIGGVGVRGPSSSSSKAGTESFSQKAFVRPSFAIVVLPTRDKIDVELVRELVHSLIRRKIIEREGRRPSSAVVASRKRGYDLESKDRRERKKYPKDMKKDDDDVRPHTKKTSPRTVSLKLATNSSVSALFSSSSSSSTPASIPSLRFFFFFSFCARVRVVCYVCCV